MRLNTRLIGLFFVLLLAVPIFAQGSSTDSSPEEAAAALKIFEQRLTSISVEGRFHLMTKIAPTAYSANDLQKAKSYSNELLVLAEQFRNNWNYGNATHVANLVLGRVALASGDIEAAKAYLLESGKTIGSPQLNSFGPNMTLAKALLEKGERDVVLEYFKLCANFWEMGRDRLDAWAAAVKEGETPNFGANLLYGTSFAMPTSTN